MTKTRFQYFLFNKPYGVLAQFTPAGGYRSLGDFGPFPGDVYPVGRLDADSEGLMLLTNDNRVNHRLTTPEFRHERTYLVQIERVPTGESLLKLSDGVVIEHQRTRQCKVRLLEADPVLPPRPVPIRFRKNVPVCWLEITLTEGRNRQVRKMTAAVGHPTLRLVRTHIGNLSLDGLLPGESRILTGSEIEDLRKSLGS